MLAVGHAGVGSRNPGETLSVDVYGDAMTDTGMGGRLFRGTKRLLGKSDIRRLMVFDHPFPVGGAGDTHPAPDARRRYPATVGSI